MASTWLLTQRESSGYGMSTLIQRVDSLEMLEASVQPHETAAQLLSRTYVEPVQTGIFFVGALRPGQLLELVGPSGSGKTELLLQAAVTTILPLQWEGVALGGQQAIVVMLDLDGKFHIGRLIEVLHSKIHGTLNGLDPEIEEEILSGCLQRFYLVRCCSSHDYLAALKSIKPLLSIVYERQGVKLLLIDNVGAFYWVDKAVRGVPPGPNHVPPRPQAAPLTFHRIHAAAAAELRNLARQFHLATLVTKTAFLPAQLPDGEQQLWAYREYLPKAWTDVVSQRALLRSLPGAEGQMLRYGAKWDMPPHPFVNHFAITPGGIMQD